MRTIILTVAAAAATLALTGVGAHAAQTQAAAGQTATTTTTTKAGGQKSTTTRKGPVPAAQRSEISKTCSAQADAKNLHGADRSKFRRQCMKG